MEVYQCKNCGKSYTYEPYECYECESKEKFQKVTDYNLLMQFAESCLDTFEEKHYYANVALYFYVKENHPLFAKRYEKVRFSTTKNYLMRD